MLEINLLPWRQRQREKKRRIAVTIFFASVIFIFIFALISHFSLSYLCAKTEKNTAVLHDKLASDDERARLVLAIEHKKQITNQSNRTLALFDALLQKTPIEVHYTAMQTHEQHIILVGNSHSAAALAKLTSNLSHAQLLEVKQASPMQFKMQID